MSSWRRCCAIVFVLCDLKALSARVGAGERRGETERRCVRLDAIRPDEASARLPPAALLSECRHRLDTSVRRETSDHPHATDAFPAGCARIAERLPQFLSRRQSCERKRTSVERFMPTSGLSASVPVRADHDASSRRPPPMLAGKHGRGVGRHALNDRDRLDDARAGCLAIFSSLSVGLKTNCSTACSQTDTEHATVT